MSSTPHFFVPSWPDDSGEIVLPESVAHRVRNVLRMQGGEAILVHDGAGFLADATLVRIEKSAVFVSVGERRPVNTEPTLAIMVAQALPKTTDKIEQVLQHGVELGASAFVFFQSERSVARMEARDKIDKKRERWNEIARHAAEQSGRGIVPSVEWEPRLSGISRRAPGFDLSLCLHEGASVPLSQRLESASPEPKSLLIVVGPEGGFSDSEVSALESAGALSTTLGPRVLRTETAALAAIAQILFRFPD